MGVGSNGTTRSSNLSGRPEQMGASEKAGSGLIVFELYTPTSLLDHATVQAATDVRQEPEVSAGKASPATRARARRAAATPESAQPATADAALQADFHERTTESAEDRAGSGEEDITVKENFPRRRNPSERPQKWTTRGQTRAWKISKNGSPTEASPAPSSETLAAMGRSAVANDSNTKYAAPGVTVRSAGRNTCRRMRAKIEVLADGTKG